MLGIGAIGQLAIGGSPIVIPPTPPPPRPSGGGGGGGGGGGLGWQSLAWRNHKAGKTPGQYIGIDGYLDATEDADTCRVDIIVRATKSLTLLTIAANESADIMVMAADIQMNVIAVDNAFLLNLDRLDYMDGGRSVAISEGRQRIYWGGAGRVMARASGGRVEASNINHKPTEAQKNAGNYAKDHVNIFGLDLTIENAKGSVRRGVGPDGKPWACVLPANYGYIKRTHGQDDDHVDVYLGPHTKSPHVFVVDQHDLRTGQMDEHKAMLGFGSQKQALACYERAFSDGKGRARIGAVTTMTVPQFKEWLATETEKRTHASVDYVEASTGKDHCAICKHFIPGNPPACTGVKSPISPMGWCKRFKPK